MIKIYRTCLPGGAWYNMVAMGARNSFDSWKDCDTSSNDAFYGPKDLELLTKLAGCDASERKFLRMMPVLMEINAPLYFWKEFDTYKIGTVSNSCSTMHTITKYPFSESHFSNDKMSEIGYVALEDLVKVLNNLRDRWKECDDAKTKKELWYNIIQLLPSSWMQRRTIGLNYEVLKTMYKERNGHKLQEWREFCEYILTLPYAKEFVMNERLKL